MGRAIEEMPGQPMSDHRQSHGGKSSNRTLQDSGRDQAVFLGWQRTRSGDLYPLYNVTAQGHPYFGSTVSEKTLRKLNLDVPMTPLPFKPSKKP